MMILNARRWWMGLALVLAGTIVPAVVHAAAEGETFSAQEPGEPAAAAPEVAPAVDTARSETTNEPSRRAGLGVLGRRLGVEALWGTFDMVGLPQTSTSNFRPATGAGMALFVDLRFWLNDAMSIRARSGYIAPQVEVHSNDGTHLRGAVPAYATFIYDFAPLMGSETFRPWVGAGTGLLMGARTNGDFSGQLSLIPELGVDLFLSRRFIIGLSAGYQITTGRQSASMLTVGLGYVFGDRT